MPDELTVRIDPHVHSDASYDGHDSIELILEQAAEIGLDAVVITDHDVLHESLRAAELAPLYGLIGIPGVEVSTAHGHLLAIGVEEMPPRRQPMDQTVQWVRDHGGVAIVPHPFQRSRHGVRKRYLTDCDAIETYNSWLFTGYKNRRSRKFAAENGYPGVAASDAHHLQFVGRAYTEITFEDTHRANVDADMILEAIRDGDTQVQGRRTPFAASTKHYGIGAARKSGYYAKVGALKSASYAKLGALQGGRFAKTGALRGARALYRLSPLSR
ncbi:Predicted metal-dependent phosphoesterase TrpH, contains PHP domain [Halogranum rubrum]|uniref:Predicted metal-dependent phosphoesterase TrpH, contains PHP domain n=2 Tax=Halogranum rubrum TaxID=553466 RepID=A0A1I4CHG2_9EURY|nr:MULTISPECIES: PHP domain-containing protein [Halogranum]EJN59351.1 metal-dependent phosphoesterase, php family [Halogranum salarium B-1]SFK80183.1 Predicted metal-dependent phosphoesterase TrpH, contains PHP domain [Halogranum rubrum]